MVNSQRSISDAPLDGDAGELDLKAYWAIAIRSWWILIVVTAAVGGLAYAISASRTPTYAATAKVLVQGAQVPGSMSLGDIEANRRFAEDFRDLLATRPILESVVSFMELPFGPGGLAAKIDARTTRRIVDITVTDPDRRMAADIANVLAREAIEHTQRRQLTQIAQLQASLSQYGLGSDAGLIAAQASTLSMLSIVEDATPASSPVGRGTLRNGILGILLGLVISGLIVALREYLDDRVRSPDELRRLTEVQDRPGVPTLGSVVRFRSDGPGEPLITGDAPPSSLTEAYKFLQTNLQFAVLDTSGLKTILVTSSTPEEGKTTTAINLATSIAREGGSSVILVDTDLRRPALHRQFDLQDRKGLTHLLLGTGTLEETASPTAIEGLRVIPAGPLPPDPPRLLRSRRMREVVAELKENADFVIFDSPPLLAVTDPMLVAALVDGVLLVVDSGRTRREPVRLAVQMLYKANPKMIGAVLNKVAVEGKGRYGGGYYDYYRYAEAGTAERDGTRRRLISRSLSRLRFRRSGASKSTDG